VAGAIVFAASAHTLTDVNPVLSLAAGLLVAGGVHAVKSVAVRPAVTATTAGVGNVPVSVLEDFVATVLSLLAVLIPLMLAGMLIVVAVILTWFVLRRDNRKHAYPRR
jgi:hypothetical protein